MKELYVLSYGAGVCSSGMFFHLIKNKYPIDLVIHADTGDTKESTYKSLEQMKLECQKRNIEFKIVTSSLGRIFDYYKKIKAVPSIIKRDCSDKFKIRVINKYLRKTYGKKIVFYNYIGFTLEEFSRMKKSKVKYKINLYPLIKDRITGNGVKKYILINKFYAKKSACIGCIFNKKLEWIKLLLEDPKQFEVYNDVEKNNTKYPNIPVKKWIKKYTIIKRVYNEKTMCYENKKILTKPYVTFNPLFRLEDFKKSWFKQELLSKHLDFEPSCDVAAGCFT